ncbi:MAG: glycosyltransferase family 2 protein [Nanoarchaeota archaeon]
MKPQPKVSVIAVNYNGKDDTLALIKSLKKTDYKNYDLIIIDNKSTNDSREALRKIRGITLIENKKNLGLAEGTNIGLREAIRRKSKYILTMNNDMEVKKNFLSILVESMESHPEVAVSGPKINYMEPRNRIWCAGCKYRMQGYKPLRQGEIDNKKEEEKYVDGIDCVLIFRTEVLEKIGLLNPRLFIIQEFTGWCLKAVNAGYKCLYVPESLVWHKVSASLESGKNKNEIVTYYTIRNWLLVIKENKNIFYFLMILFFEATIFAAFRFIKYLSWKKPGLIFVYYMAIWHGLLNKTQDELVKFG